MRRREEVSSELLSQTPSAPGTRLATLHQELSQLEHALSQYERLRQREHEWLSLRQMAHDDAEDEQLRQLALDELSSAESSLTSKREEVEYLMLPPDDADDDCSSLVLEVRAGAGGEEASLFAHELFEMYKQHAYRKSWIFETLGDVSASSTLTGKRGVREATATVSGDGCFSRLKWESGVHRVQRVPETETAGRLHTSTASVAVLPQAEKLDDGVDEADVRVDTMRASGSGGQHVNTTESAVRVTHIPTGTKVEMQDDRSQHKNRERAMKLLRARVYGAKREQQRRERMQIRRSIIGSMDRSERIRTYNFPRQDVKDHRCNVTVHNLNTFMAEGEGIDELVNALEDIDRRERLKRMREESGSDERAIEIE